LQNIGNGVGATSQTAAFAACFEYSRGDCRLLWGKKQTGRPGD